MDIRKTDPEYAEILERFRRDEAINGDEVRLPARPHYLAVLAALMGCGGTEAYRELLPEALERGLSPVAVKEVVYQATRLSGVRTGSAVPQSDQRGSDRRRGIAPAGGAGDRDAGEPAGAGSTGAGGDLRRADTAGMADGNRQPLAGGKLLRGLLHPPGAVASRAGADYLLLSCGAGRL